MDITFKCTNLYATSLPDLKEDLVRAASSLDKVVAATQRDAPKGTAQVSVAFLNENGRLQGYTAHFFGEDRKVLRMIDYNHEGSRI